MTIREDGTYYLISCDQCGAEIKKHKSYGTKYGVAYHFNPELKCPNCGSSAKIVYGGSITPSSPSNPSCSNKIDAKILCPKCNSTQISAEEKEYSTEKAIAGVVLEGGVKTARFRNQKEIPIEAVTENSPAFIKNRIDVKVETIIAANTVLNELTKEAIINKNAKLMIVTNFGVVEGTLKQEVDANDLAQQICLSFAKVRNNNLAKAEKEVASSTITNNSYFVTILDAKVIPFSNPSKIVTFAVLNLFSDKIVGFTFGEYQTK